MHDAERFQRVFAAALAWPAYLASARDHERPGWERAWQRTVLSDPQHRMLHSLTRRINVLVISGTWCGDCVRQCPILARAQEAHPAAPDDPRAPGLDVRFIDRESDPEFGRPFMICGGRRVPVAIFLNEEFEFVSMLGDKTLSRLRRLASQELGAHCPLPGADVSGDETAEVIRDWLTEIERVGLLLRLSPKLREVHGD
jgi:thiol-disulfide isomerase/thioredoxin